jgi:hypothetical protein
MAWFSICKSAGLLTTFTTHFITKTPRSAPAFLQNPLQKRLSTSSKKTAKK